MISLYFRQYRFLDIELQALSQSIHAVTVILPRKISPGQLASFTDFRRSSMAWLEIWKMTPFLQHASLTELLAFKQHICSMFNSNSLLYQRFTEHLHWSSPIEGDGNTAIINRWKPFPSGTYILEGRHTINKIKK